MIHRVFCWPLIIFPLSALHPLISESAWSSRNTSDIRNFHFCRQRACIVSYKITSGTRRRCRQWKKKTRCQTLARQSYLVMWNWDVEGRMHDLAIAYHHLNLSAKTFAGSWCGQTEIYKEEDPEGGFCCWGSWRFPMLYSLCAHCMLYSLCAHCVVHDQTQSCLKIRLLYIVVTFMKSRKLDRPKDP